MFLSVFLTWIAVFNLIWLQWRLFRQIHKDFPYHPHIFLSYITHVIKNLQGLDCKNLKPHLIEIWPALPLKVVSLEMSGQLPAAAVCTFLSWQTSNLRRKPTPNFVFKVTQIFHGEPSLVIRAGSLAVNKQFSAERSAASKPESSVSRATPGSYTVLFCFFWLSVGCGSRIHLLSYIENECFLGGFLAFLKK